MRVPVRQSVGPARRTCAGAAVAVGVTTGSRAATRGDGATRQGRAGSACVTGVNPGGSLRDPAP